MGGLPINQMTYQHHQLARSVNFLISPHDWFCLHETNLVVKWYHPYGLSCTWYHPYGVSCTNPVLLWQFLFDYQVCLSKQAVAPLLFNIALPMFYRSTTVSWNNLFVRSFFQACFELLLLDAAFENCSMSALVLLKLSPFSREAASEGPTILHIRFCSLSNNSR